MDFVEETCRSECGKTGWPVSISSLHELITEKEKQKEIQKKMKLAELKAHLEALQSQGKLMIKEWKQKQLTMVWVVAPLADSGNPTANKPKSPGSEGIINGLEEELERLTEEENKLKAQQKGANIDTEMNQYIDLLHRYNELKDAGQILLGKLAELEGITTKDMYARYSLDLED